MIHQEIIVEARHADQTGVIRSARSRADGVRVPKLTILDTCPYCSALYRAHPGWSDHRDQCDLRPMNRPHIIGTANAPGIDCSLRSAIDDLPGGDVDAK